MANNPLDMVEPEGWSFIGECTETVSGGELVKALSSTGAGTSRLDEVIEIGRADAAADIPKIVGIALTNAASGEKVTVATAGIYRMQAAAACTAGDIVRGECATGSADAVRYQAVGVGSVIGRALNDAAANEKVFVKLNL